MILETRAFEGGCCRQILAMVDRRSWRTVRFQAVFLALKHSREGWVLVDTGYGRRFADSTARFPYRLHRWATPVTPAGSAADQLAAAGISPDEIRHVVVTHFHADHIGGLAEFPGATIHFREDALGALQRLRPFRQVRAAFIPALVPEWLGERARPLASGAFSGTSDMPFLSHDLFGDGSLRLVYLPGHAPGHIGAAFPSRHGQELYATDAYWRDCQLTAGVEPLGIAMSLQWNPADYRRTVAQLREVRRGGRFRVTACHDRGTSATLNGGVVLP